MDGGDRMDFWGWVVTKKVENERKCTWGQMRKTKKEEGGSEEVGAKLISLMSLQSILPQHLSNDLCAQGRVEGLTADQTISHEGIWVTANNMKLLVAYIIDKFIPCSNLLSI